MGDLVGFRGVSESKLISSVPACPLREGIRDTNDRAYYG